MRGAEPGERRGGRQKGTLNRKTQEVITEITASGLTPMEFMLMVMRDESEEMPRRLDAAKNVAPYVHPRLATIEHTGKDGDPLIQNADPMEIARSVAFILNQAGKGET